jgi:hypothetical protein
MVKEQKTAAELATMLEERIGRRGKVTVMRDHPINNWYAAVAPGTRNILQLQEDVNRICDALREHYQLKES